MTRRSSKTEALQDECLDPADMVKAPNDSAFVEELLAARQEVLKRRPAICAGVLPWSAMSEAMQDIYEDVGQKHDFGQLRGTVRHTPAFLHACSVLHARQ